MTIIKGPITIKMNGRSIAEYVKEQVDEPTLPFTATGWKSDKNQELVTSKPEVVTGKAKAQKPSKKKKTKKN